jgi:hypothetical protein
MPGSRHILKHITLGVDEVTYNRARIWAARRHTSVSAVVRYLLQRLPGLPAAREFQALKLQPAASPAEAPHRPTAEEIAAFTAPPPSKM